VLRHACDVASASPAAIAFPEVGTARSIRPTLTGQSLRRAWFPVQAAYASQSLVTIRHTPHGAEDREATPSRVVDLLAYLDKANLFLIPLDRERHWYRYHHLFAELLRARLNAPMPPWPSSDSMR
jgi:hypothetical protein